MAAGECYTITIVIKEVTVATTNEEKKQYVKEYIRSLAAIEECIEPYQEQKRELRTEFRENGWLNTDEIRAAVKAYRLYKQKYNIDEVVDNFTLISGEGEEQ
jgi:hypothetical protein